MEAIVPFLIGTATGVLSGFGIGGGSLLILYLTSFAGINQVVAGGINLLYFACCAPAALISHIKNHLVESKAVWICAGAGVVTSLGGSLLASVLDVGLLRRFFGILLIYIGIREVCCKQSRSPTNNPPH